MLANRIHLALLLSNISYFMAELLIKFSIDCVQANMDVGIKVP